MDGASATAPEVQEAERELRMFRWSKPAQFSTGSRSVFPASSNNPRRGGWWVCFMTTASIATFGLFCIGYQISTGVGTWGNQIPVGWAWDITNFVFWIGIGHAGTLISAILFLLRQKWRTSIIVPRKR